MKCSASRPRDPPGSLNPKLTPYLASRSPIPRLVRDTTRSLQKLAVSLLTYDISAIDYEGQRIILDGFCEISRLKGMPSPQGAVVVASGGSQGRGGGNALRAIPRQDPRFGYTVRGGWCLESRAARNPGRVRQRLPRSLPILQLPAPPRAFATQIEHEVLRFSDPDKQAVLAIVLKHFDSF